jgi:hypothetical protein
MASVVRHLPAVALPLLFIVSCASIDGTKDRLLEASAASRFPDCASEIQAYFALNRLATQSGADEDVFEPALDALQDQMTDCVDDAYGGTSDIWPIASHSPPRSVARSIDPSPHQTAPSDGATSTQPRRW